jgi:hypothetical protein
MLWYEWIIFIVGCCIIGYVIYRQVKDMMYNTLVTRQMEGRDIEGFPKFKEFEEQISGMTRDIIEHYEEAKHKSKKKNNKEDNMFQ